MYLAAAVSASVSASVCQGRCHGRQMPLQDYHRLVSAGLLLFGPRASPSPDPPPAVSRVCGHLVAGCAKQRLSCIDKPIAAVAVRIIKLSVRQQLPRTHSPPASANAASVQHSASSASSAQTDRLVAIIVSMLVCRASTFRRPSPPPSLGVIPSAAEQALTRRAHLPSPYWWARAIVCELDSLENAGPSTSPFSLLSYIDRAAVTHPSLASPSAHHPATSFLPRAWGETD